jgi:hypothetical protein
MIPAPFKIRGDVLMQGRHRQLLAHTCMPLGVVCQERNEREEAQISLSILVVGFRLNRNLRFLLLFGLLRFKNLNLLLRVHTTTTKG